MRYPPLNFSKATRNPIFAPHLKSEGSRLACSHQTFRLPDLLPELLAPLPWRAGGPSLNPSHRRRPPLLPSLPSRSIWPTVRVTAKTFWTFRSGTPSDRIQTSESLFPMSLLLSRRCFSRGQCFTWSQSRASCFRRKSLRASCCARKPLTSRVLSQLPLSER